MASQDRTTTAAALAALGLARGVRVGSTNRARRFGHVLAVADNAVVLVKWDDGSASVVSWASVAAL